MTVYEKSKTFGGRCATRTSRESPGVKYDTGAQYYSLKAVMESIHKRWESAGVVAPWFQDAKGFIFTFILSFHHSFVHLFFHSIILSFLHSIILSSIILLFELLFVFSFAFVFVCVHLSLLLHSISFSLLIIITAPLLSTTINLLQIQLIILSISCIILYCTYCTYRRSSYEKFDRNVSIIKTTCF